jgi:hypothetical protein
VVYLVEATGVLGAVPTYTQTGAGPIRDEATYWVAAFSYRHATLWNYLVRDGLFFFAYLGFIPVALAANVATGGRRASVQLAAAFIGVGAIFGALNAVTFLVDVWWWRSSGWEQTAPEIMIAVGRSTEMISDLSFWYGAAANVALAIGLGYLAAACFTEPALPRRIGWVALVTALVQLMIVGAALTDGMEHVHSVLSLVTGVVLAPMILIGLGLRLAGDIASAGSAQKARP